MYNSSFVLSAYVADNKHLCNGMRVIELGAGTGLVSVTCLLCCQPKFLLCTDGDECLLKLTQHNIIRNMNSQCNLEAAKDANYKTMKLLWGETIATEDKFDLIVCSGTALLYIIYVDTNMCITCIDVVAFPYALHYDSLIETFLDLSHKDSIILLTYQERQIGEKVFFIRCKRYFDIVEVERKHLHKDFVSEAHNLPFPPIKLFRIVRKRAV